MQQETGFDFKISILVIHLMWLPEVQNPPTLSKSRPVFYSGLEECPEQIIQG